MNEEKALQLLDALKKQQAALQKYGFKRSLEKNNRNERNTNEKDW